MALMESPFKIILGSSSVARRHILAKMGYDFTVMTADIDEKAIRKEKPEELVTALAEAKAEAILSRLQNVDSFVEDVHTTLLITADTNDLIYENRRDRRWFLSFIAVFAESYFLLIGLIDLEVVVHEGRIREKPSSKDEARHFIEGYSGGRAEVVGSVLVTNLKTGRREAGWERAEVYFHDIPAQIVQSLIEEGITLNVAGGLMLEHPLTSPFVKEVIGTADTVMGLPKSLTERLIQEALTCP
ncbi:uncharacterized protein LOC115688155 isoform X1 [Syzygium oleosum]|uniref:uncharacterized protein LOC115688155 isoform X1 n=1 Tax=Syzygium oleosum TaxID=219896 RepID=UPI0024BBADBD|nr:uncharacterized protein LOC115688155 isoform X1 [Syzygium oleosum]